MTQQYLSRSTRLYCLYITMADEEGWLQVEKIPWWKGGGSKHFRVPNVSAETMLTYEQAQEYIQMYKQAPAENHVAKHQVHLGS